MSDRLRQRVESFGKALARLDEALDVDPGAPLAVDGTIQRFEFTFELGWKALKAALANEGIDAATPRAALREAFAVGWIDDEDAWLTMLSDRNLTSHVYSEEASAEIYGRVRENARALHDAFRVVSSRLQTDS